MCLADNGAIAPLSQIIQAIALSQLGRKSLCVGQSKDLSLVLLRKTVPLRLKERQT
ncbi:MAG: hypothetical protein V7L29_10940 [Nostoc sp.]|uniref:hypothetical protein n=1 Tax=Nostoc sp. TaxID=1180 RepID=UPI002FF3E3D6